MLIKEVTEKVACDIIASVMGIGDFYDKNSGYKGDVWQDGGNAVVTTFRSDEPSDQIQILSNWDRKSKEFKVVGYRKGFQRIKKGSRFDLANLEVIDDDGNITVFSDFDTKFGIDSKKVYGPDSEVGGRKSAKKPTSLAEVMSAVAGFNHEELATLRDAIVVTLLSREVSQTPVVHVEVQTPAESVEVPTEAEIPVESVEKSDEAVESTEATVEATVEVPAEVPAEVPVDEEVTDFTGDLID